ncbi:hypothetical protein CO038_01075 [Candidatus Pacearchaeota archaeon CG_4_9_14_0_2_um_filter_39_13]|nr:class 1 isoprenoid biosynthesis enzyme [Candidatus Pacearchaeota archaeon]OIO43530.1 MAG: hypothetical protein AUJ64_02315 [Candidatus Pacearchaeota archaeon CG1_02_39_14]PJC44945.1 MAG: hypothetical protein CO038_01075 [Candidatus Pacearchaeota archaeon CG_4_9_14_0_2_um_filter_39_13]
MEKQVSNTGCDPKEIPESWASNSVLRLSLDVSLVFLDKKRELICENCLNPPLRFFEDYLEQPCVPEILANCLCDLGGKTNLKETSSLLEAFQTYAVSLYDQISDGHISRNGEPTVLGAHGITETLRVKDACEQIFRRLARDLEERIPNAAKIAEEQYALTLSADKMRNLPKILPPNEAIELQNQLAGLPSEKIAHLCEGDLEIVTLSRTTGLALSTIDDLIDLIKLEDLKGRKTTLPLSYLHQSNPSILNESPEKIVEYFLNSDALRRTLDYIHKNIEKSRRILRRRDPKQQSILMKYNDEISRYLETLEK